MVDMPVRMWEVYTTIDEYGRDGEMVGLFSDEVMANAAAKGKGWWGGKGDVRPVFALDCHNGYYQVLKYRNPVKADTDIVKLREDIKTKALAKLTEEEKALLGLPTN